MAFPTVTDINVDLSTSVLNEFFDELAKSKMKTIVSFLEGETLNYLVSEVTK